MLSLLEGFEIDPQFAVTGDITVDWKVREIGGVPAKLMGAAADGCTCAAIPVANEADVDDMRLLSGDASLWNIQVFSIDTLQNAVLLLRTDRPKEVDDAIARFSAAKALYVNAGRNWVHDAGIRKQLGEVLAAAPNHLSAKHLLAVMDNKAPQRLSLQESIAQWESLNHVYAALVDSKKGVDRYSLPVAVTIAERKRLNGLRLIADKRMLPLLAEYSNFIELMDQIADGKSRIDVVAAKQHLEALVSKEQELLGTH